MEVTDKIASLRPPRIGMTYSKLICTLTFFSTTRQTRPWLCPTKHLELRIRQFRAFFGELIFMRGQMYHDKVQREMKLSNNHVAVPKKCLNNRVIQCWRFSGLFSPSKIMDRGNRMLWTFAGFWICYRRIEDDAKEKEERSLLIPACSFYVLSFSLNVDYARICVCSYCCDLPAGTERNLNLKCSGSYRCPAALLALGHIHCRDGKPKTRVYRILGKMFGRFLWIWFIPLPHLI